LTNWETASFSRRTTTKGAELNDLPDLKAEIQALTGPLLQKKKSLVHKNKPNEHYLEIL
jgi:hypothetical protein